MNWAIMELYCGGSGKAGYYNSQELGLARALKKYGIHVTIVYPDRELQKETEESPEENITILRVPCRSFGVHAFYDLSFLATRKIEVVHLDSDNQMYAPGVIRYCRKHHIFCYNYIGTVFSDTENWLKGLLMKRISRRNIRYFRGMLTFAKTESVRETLEREGVSGVRVAPVGLDTSVIRKTAESRAELRRRLALPEELKLLLFVGRLEAYKRPFAALELLERLGGQYGLVVSGDGSLSERFQETAAEKGLLDRFFYFRRVPNVEMYRYYAACDYFVNFNTHEIFGMSILEAMYQGCVVAARRAPGPEQIIEDGVSGFLCSSDQEMDQVFSDPRTERMGEAAEKRIQDCFTWDRTAEQIRAQVLKQLTGRQRAEEGKE